MRLRTSVTLSPEILQALDELGGNRSRHVEEAVRVYLARVRRQERDARDRRLIEEHAEELNAEMADVLAFQEPW